MTNDFKEEFSRTALLIGQEGINKLSNSRIAVFGVGGVGGYCVEALARCAVGHIDIIDNDKVALSNINRQIYALHSNVGEYKVDAAKKRIKDINSDIEVNTYNIFYSSETSNIIDFKKYDYIVDAIDTVSAKISLIEKSKEFDVPIICAMGAGNKLDPTKFEVADISKTSVCPLARVIRAELKKRNIKNVKVVYSKELPVKIQKNIDKSSNKIIPASISFVPSVVGLIIASEVIKDLCN